MSHVHPRQSRMVKLTIVLIASGSLCTSHVIMSVFLSNLMTVVSYKNYDFIIENEFTVKCNTQFC